MEKTLAILRGHLREMLLQEFHRPANGCKRGLELVRHVGRESAYVVCPAFESGRHLSQSLRQEVHFVRAGVRQWNRYSTLFATCHLLGLTNKGFHRPGDQKSR